MRRWARLALLVAVTIVLAACKDDTTGQLTPCGPGGTCISGDICDPTVNLCYKRGSNHCPEVVLKPGVSPADAGVSCNLLSYCCDTFTFNDGGMFNECEANGGACGTFTTECGFGCYGL